MGEEKQQEEPDLVPLQAPSECRLSLRSLLSRPPGLAGALLPPIRKTGHALADPPARTDALPHSTLPPGSPLLSDSRLKPLPHGKTGT